MLTFNRSSTTFFLKLAFLLNNLKTTMNSQGPCLNFYMKFSTKCMVQLCCKKSTRANLMLSLLVQNCKQSSWSWVVKSKRQRKAKLCFKNFSGNKTNSISVDCLWLSIYWYFYPRKELKFWQKQSLITSKWSQTFTMTLLFFLFNW